MYSILYSLVLDQYRIYYLVSRLGGAQTFKIHGVIIDNNNNNNYYYYYSSIRLHHYQCIFHVFAQKMANPSIFLTHSNFPRQFWQFNC